MKKNAYNVCLVDVNYGRNTRINVPAEAIAEAGFNTKNPIYVQKVGNNHSRLTQDGSMPGLVGKVNGWMKSMKLNGKTKQYKQYQIGASKIFPYADFVTMEVDKIGRCIEMFAVTCDF